VADLDLGDETPIAETVTSFTTHGIPRGGRERNGRTIRELTLRSPYIGMQCLSQCVLNETGDRLASTGSFSYRAGVQLIVNIEDRLH